MVFILCRLASLKQIKSQLSSKHCNLSAQIQEEEKANETQAESSNELENEHKELLSSLDKMSFELDRLERKQMDLFKDEQPKLSENPVQNNESDEISINELIGRLMDASVEDLEAGLAKFVPAVERPTAAPAAESAAEPQNLINDDLPLTADSKNGYVNDELNSSIKSASSKIKSTKEALFINFS